MRWECRYSSCEMMYLEMSDSDVRCYLHHSPQSADVWSFEQVLKGEMSNEVYCLFSGEIAAVKAAVRARMEATAPGSTAKFNAAL